MGPAEKTFYSHFNQILHFKKTRDAPKVFAAKVIVKVAYEPMACSLLTEGSPFNAERTMTGVSVWL